MGGGPLTPEAQHANWELGLLEGSVHEIIGLGHEFVEHGGRV
jgi:hypothetical protein